MMKAIRDNKNASFISDKLAKLIKAVEMLKVGIENSPDYTDEYYNSRVEDFYPEFSNFVKSLIKNPYDEDELLFIAKLLYSKSNAADCIEILNNYFNTNISLSEVRSIVNFDVNTEYIKNDKNQIIYYSITVSSEAFIINTNYENILNDLLRTLYIYSTNGSAITNIDYYYNIIITNNLSKSISNDIIQKYDFNTFYYKDGTNINEGL